MLEKELQQSVIDHLTKTSAKTFINDGSFTFKFSFHQL